MKNNYLVLIMTTEYIQDFLIIQSESAEKAKETVQVLPKVLDVISVWTENRDV